MLAVKHELSNGLVIRYMKKLYNLAGIHCGSRGLAESLKVRSGRDR